MTGFFLVAAAILSLNGLWDFRMERARPMEELAALPAFEADDKMVVPGAWDATSRYYNQRGTGCYRRKFACGRFYRDAKLVVDGMGLRARFWLDGRDLGLVKLPWSRFELDLGPLQTGEHEIVAAVDSVVDGSRTKLFHDFYDFYPFGGFHHGVWIEAMEQQDDWRRVVVRTRDYKTGLVELQLEPWSERGNGFLDGTFEVSFDTTGDKSLSVPFKGGKALVKVPDFKPWSPEAPNLHTVTVACLNSSKAMPVATARFGIRQVGTEKGRVTLNGKPVYLKGANRHEAHFEFGCTTPRQLMYEDIRNVKDLGGNFIRGAHYAQCDEFLGLCDEMGVLVWEESLGWGNRTADFDDPEFCDLQEEQTRLMVRNSINHPSVIVSAFLNEPWSDQPACRKLVDRLLAAVRAEDSGHLVTFACNCTERDICHAGTDIIAYNAYPGWYGGEPADGSTEALRTSIRNTHAAIVRNFREKYKDDRPIIVSESGVKADYGAHDPRGRAQYSEEFQAEYTRLMLEEVFALKDIAGIAVWQLTDAKTYTRTKGMNGRPYGVNTGGLYDLYRRPKMAVETVRELFPLSPR